MATKFQTVKDRYVKRTLHVWKELKNGSFKCVLCGGITHQPSDDADCDRYERLTDQERELCPMGATPKA